MVVVVSDFWLALVAIDTARIAEQITVERSNNVTIFETMASFTPSSFERDGFIDPQIAHIVESESELERSKTSFFSRFSIPPQALNQRFPSVLSMFQV